MLAPLRNQIFVSYLEQYLQSITAVKLSWQGTSNFPCGAAQSRCCSFSNLAGLQNLFQGLSGWMLSHDLNSLICRPSCRQSVTVTTVRALLYNDLPPWNYHCSRWLLSTSAQHALLSIVLQMVATSQTFTSLFCHEVNTGTMTGAFVTLKVANLSAVQFHNGNLGWFFNIL